MQLMLTPGFQPAPALAASSPSRISAEEVENVVRRRSSVLPALTVPQYVARIKATRVSALRSLSALIDRGNFKAASEGLVLDPFDTVYQSARYLPWALVTVDVGAAEACFDAYVQLVEDMKAFDRLCAAASRAQAEEEDVVAGLAAIDADISALLATLPPSALL